MAGKPKKEGSQTPGWGGSRPNTGPKAVKPTAEMIKVMLRTAKKMARAEGKSIDEILIAFCYGKGATKITVKDRIAAIRTFKEFTMAKQTDQEVTVTARTEPAIYLPKQKSDPALSLVKAVNE
jgi:hypothetical protein